MMQPEDKTQEIAERAERLQEIGSSILRAARDELYLGCLLYTSPSPRDRQKSRMPSSA